MSNLQRRIELLRGVSSEIHAQQAAQARARMSRRKAQLLSACELVSTVVLLVLILFVVVTALTKGFVTWWVQ